MFDSTQKFSEESFNRVHLFCLKLFYKILKSLIPNKFLQRKLKIMFLNYSALFNEILESLIPH